MYSHSSTTLPVTWSDGWKYKLLPSMYLQPGDGSTSLQWISTNRKFLGLLPGFK